MTYLLIYLLGGALYGLVVVWQTNWKTVYQLGALPLALGALAVCVVLWPIALLFDLLTPPIR